MATGYINNILSTSLSPLNTKLAKYGLQLSEAGSGWSNSLILTQATPAPTNTTVTFTTDAKDKTPRQDYITKTGEGLLVQVGTPRTSPNVFSTTDTLYTAPLSWAGGTPPTWTGSALLPAGTYNWQLWKTTQYQGNVLKAFINKGTTVPNQITVDASGTVTPSLPVPLDHA